MISLQNISFKSILSDISMTIREGDHIGIAGPNGSGKSTLARIIKGLVVPTEGTVNINGFIRPGGKVSGEIGLVLANPENQLISSSIEEDVAFGLENLNLPSLEIAKRTEEALIWSGLWDSRYVPAHHLSACQQQMLVLAGMMAMRPKYLILDEATSMIGPEGRDVIIEAVRRMNRELGVAVIHISHELSDLLGTQNIYFMDRGKVVWQGAPTVLHRQEQLLQELGLELPPILKLKSMMVKEGYSMDENAVTVNEIAKEIAKSINLTRK